MSQRGIEFANNWISENVNPGPYEPGPEIIEALSTELIAAAAKAGVSEDEIEEDMGDIRDLIAEAHENATDNEVERLATKYD